MLLTAGSKGAREVERDNACVPLRACWTTVDLMRLRAREALISSLVTFARRGTRRTCAHGDQRDGMSITMARLM